MIHNTDTSGGGSGVETVTLTIFSPSSKVPPHFYYYDGSSFQELQPSQDTTIVVAKNSIVALNTGMMNYTMTGDAEWESLAYDSDVIIQVSGNCAIYFS